MRELEINKKTIFYSNPLSPTPILDENGFETGELEHRFTEPKPYRINVSPAKGRISVEMFGESENYDKTMVTCDKNADIHKGTILWVDNLDTSRPEDYIVVAVAEDINTMSYAIRKVKVNE